MNTKEYNYNYYQAHKEKQKQVVKEWREKNPEKVKIYRKKASAKWKKKNPNYDHTWYKKYRQSLTELFGDTCILCGYKSNIYIKGSIHIHEIHGSKHEYHRLESYLKKRGDFVPLCNFCHKCLHYYTNMVNKKKFHELVDILMIAKSLNIPSAY